MGEGEVQASNRGTCEIRYGMVWYGIQLKKLEGERERDLLSSPHLLHVYDSSCSDLLPDSLSHLPLISLSPCPWRRNADGRTHNNLSISQHPTHSLSTLSTSRCQSTSAVLYSRVHGSDHERASTLCSTRIAGVRGVSV